MFDLQNESTSDSIVLAIFCCPRSKAQLRPMSADEIANLNLRISTGELNHLSGNPVTLSIKSALIAETESIVYPIVDDVFCFLPHIAIALKDHHLPTTDALSLQQLTEFYDQFGWKKTSAETFQDAASFEDLRSVSASYIHRCHMRLNRYIQRPGKYLLDVASGPVQFEEYISYSDGFDYRICVDVSIVALRQAKEKLGARAICVLADIVNLPFSTDMIDGVISLHTIYHVDENKQHQAIEELHRVLKPTGSAIVVYSWGSHCWLMNLLNLPAVLTKPIRDLIRLGTKSPASSAPPLYFRPHSFDWFKSQTWSFDYEIAVWRSVSVTFLKTYIHASLLGRKILQCVYCVEEQFPRLSGLFGQYPILLIRKKRSNKT